jgi:hypothetical protein
MIEGESKIGFREKLKQMLIKLEIKKAKKEATIFSNRFHIPKEFNFDHQESELFTLNFAKYLIGKTNEEPYYPEDEDSASLMVFFEFDKYIYKIRESAANILKETTIENFKKLDDNSPEKQKTLGIDLLAHTLSTSFLNNPGNSNLIRKHIANLKQKSIYGKS